MMCHVTHLQGGARGDGGIRRGDPNKFDSLCDGVLGTLALVNAALHEVCILTVDVCPKIDVYMLYSHAEVDCILQYGL